MYRSPTAGGHVQRCLDDLVRGPERQAAGRTRGHLNDSVGLGVAISMPGWPS